MGLQTSPGEDLGDVSPSLRRNEAGGRLLGALQGGCEAQGGSRNRAARGEGAPAARELLSGFHCRQPQGLGTGGEGTLEGRNYSGQGWGLAPAPSRMEAGTLGGWHPEGGTRRCIPCPAALHPLYSEQGDVLEKAHE